MSTSSIYCINLTLLFRKSTVDQSRFDCLSTLRLSRAFTICFFPPLLVRLVLPFLQHMTIMSESNHPERHVTNNDVMRNFIIGFSDGLTVPFALTAVGIGIMHNSKQRLTYHRACPPSGPHV